MTAKYKNVQFEQSYISLRRNEGWLLPDSEVAALPETAKEHKLHKSWNIRKNSIAPFIQYLEKFKSPLRILEVGCGNGWLSHLMSKIKDSRVYGLDINAIELQQARNAFSNSLNLNFLQADFLKFTPEQKFDVIVFAASIQYFHDFAEAVNHALAMLSENGEIHILDSLFYKRNELIAAKERSHEYFLQAGFPELESYYFHHAIDELTHYNHRVIKSPPSKWNILRKDPTPFYWVRIKHSA